MSTPNRDELSAAAYLDAADEVHKEARWQQEMWVRQTPVTDPVHRLLMVEAILRERASQFPPAPTHNEDDDGSAAFQALNDARPRRHHTAPTHNFSHGPGCDCGSPTHNETRQDHVRSLFAPTHNETGWRCDNDQPCPCSHHTTHNETAGDAVREADLMALRMACEDRASWRGEAVRSADERDAARAELAGLRERIKALLANVHVVPVLTLDGETNAPVIWPHELSAALAAAPTGPTTGGETP